MVTGRVPVLFLFLGINGGTGACPSSSCKHWWTQAENHWIRLPETCYSVFGKSLMIDLTCTASQAVHIVNTNEIGPRRKLWCSTHKLSNFIELDLVVFNIIAFKMISNFFETAYTYTHTYTHIYIHTHLYIYIYIYIYTYVRLSVCVCVCSWAAVLYLSRCD